VYGIKCKYSFVRFRAEAHGIKIGFMPESTVHGRRKRNPRGQGHRLREEILAGATTILERTGSEEAVTLRAIAREIGISAPSITDHFSDRAAIIDAVVAAKIADLSGQLIAAVESASDPVERLLAACRAYVGFGRAHPTHYRIIFERRFLPIWDREQRAMVETTPLFLDAVGLVMRSVQACIDAGQSTGTDAFADTIALWYFVHGMVALPTTITSLPWPEPEAHLEAYVRLLTHLID
jgi:AcrR family transcriptional regulator